MNIIWFDFDGTIAQVDERFYQVHLAICHELSISSLSKKDYWQARCNGISTENILKSLNASHLLEQYIVRRNKLLESQEFLKYDKLRNHVIETLCELKIYHKLNLLTGRSNKVNLNFQLENMNIRQYFNDIFMVSPFSKWEEKAAVLSKFSSESSSMVGDAPNDIIAGKNANIKTIGILHGMSTIAALSKLHPDFIITDFSEIKNIIDAKHNPDVVG